MKNAPVVRLILLGCLVVGGTVAAWLWRDRLAPILEWVHNLGFWGLVLLALAYLGAALVSFPPAALLTIAAGAFYEVLPATIAISLGSTFAATVAFLLGRTLARGWVEARVEKQPLFKALDAAVAEGGFKIVLLTRLSPLLPFVVLNYAYGLTKVKLRDFVLASWIGMLPGTLLYIYIGSTVRSAAALAGSAATNTGIAGRVLWWVGLAATLLVTVLVTRQARQALKRALNTTGDKGHTPSPKAAHSAERLIVAPPDEFNRELLDNVHPAGWTNPEPPPRYHLVVDRRRYGGAGVGGRGRGTRRPRRPGRARPARRRLPQRRLCALQGAAPRRSRRRRRSPTPAASASSAADMAVDFPASHGADAAAAASDRAATTPPPASAASAWMSSWAAADSPAKIPSRSPARRCASAGPSSPPARGPPGRTSLAWRKSAISPMKRVFNLTELPRRLAVIGAGPIGCELAQAFARFGTEVFLLGKHRSLLPREDADAAGAGAKGDGTGRREAAPRRSDRAAPRSRVTTR